jgi:hypothetical protein
MANLKLQKCDYEVATRRALCDNVKSILSIEGDTVTVD